LNGEALQKPTAVSSNTIYKSLERISFPALIATAVAGLLALATCAQSDSAADRSLRVGTVIMDRPSIGTLPHG
jgi:uncharacterized membrane protein YbhN (UPF0104 family)